MRTQRMPVLSMHEYGLQRLQAKVFEHTWNSHSARNATEGCFLALCCDAITGLAGAEVLTL